MSYRYVNPLVPVRCAECGTSGVLGRRHYPGGDPENGPAHEVVEISDLRKRLAERVRRVERGHVTKAQDLAADILMASIYSDLPEPQTRKLLRHLAHASGIDYVKLRKQAEKRVYGNG